MVRQLNIWVYILGIISILSMIMYLYILFAKKENVIKESMILYQTETIQVQKNKLESWLDASCQENKAIQKCLLDDPDKSKQLNRLLSLMINQDIRFVFLVYRDERGRYRFIADGEVQPPH